MTYKPKPMGIVVPKGDERPPYLDFPYYIAQPTTWFINSPTMWGTVQKKTDSKPPDIPIMDERLKLNGTKLPRYVVSQALDFFRKVWKKQKTEATTYITYDHATSRFGLFIPQQYVSHASVSHKLDRSKLPTNIQTVGTIHSHCDFNAFHSGTDMADMAKLPGLHITIGHIDTDKPSMAIAISAEKLRWDLEPEEIIDESLDKNHLGYATAPDWWLNFVHEGSAPWGKDGEVRQRENQQKLYPVKTVHSNQTQFGFDLQQNGVYIPQWRVEQQKREEQKALAEAQWGSLLKPIREQLEEFRLLSALLGFQMNASISYSPISAENIIKSYSINNSAEIEAIRDKYKLRKENDASHAASSAN